jgi:hypothetical protein
MIERLVHVYGLTSRDAEGYSLDLAGDEVGSPPLSLTVEDLIGLDAMQGPAANAAFDEKLRQGFDSGRLISLFASRCTLAGPPDSSMRRTSASHDWGPCASSGAARCVGRCVECRINLRKPKGGKVIGERGLAGEDGA